MFKLLPLLLLAAFIGAATPTHAQQVQSDVQEWADWVGIDVQDLQGAVNTTGMHPEDYLVALGVVQRKPATPREYLYATYGTNGTTRRMDCVIGYESQWDTNARNPRSDAGGLGQFLASTWARTPQARQGMSRFDPYAAIDGMYWMVAQGGGSWGEWQVVQVGLC